MKRWTADDYQAHAILLARAQAAEARVRELEEALYALRKSTVLLITDAAHGHAIAWEHYSGGGSSEPGWLRDCRAEVERANSVLSPDRAALRSGEAEG